jgi:hypothetical protein
MLPLNPGVIANLLAQVDYVYRHLPPVGLLPPKESGEFDSEGLLERKKLPKGVFKIY